MGFMDWIKMIGGGVAAPFTGGATLPIALSGAGGVLSGAADAAGKSRGNQLQAQEDMFKNNLAAAGLGLQEEQQGQGVLNNAWKRLLQSSYVQNNATPYKPAVAGMPSFGIAMKPYGADLSVAQGAAEQQSNARKDINNPMRNMPAIPGSPNLSQLAKTPWWQTLLGLAGGGLQAAGMASALGDSNRT